MEFSHSLGQKQTLPRSPLMAIVNKAPQVSSQIDEAKLVEVCTQ